MNTVIFLDLDNTVMRNPFESAVFPRIARQMSDQGSVTPQQARDAINDEFFRRMAPDSHCPPALVFDWDDIVTTVAESLHIGGITPLHLLVEEYAHAPYVQILDAADRVLHEMRRPWRKLIAATNGLSKYQVPVLDALDLTCQFDGFLSPDTTGALKGWKAFYEGAMSPGACAVSIGDSYAQDIVGPKELGMWTIWVRNGTTTFSPDIPTDSSAADYVVENFHQVPALIDEIESSTACTTPRRSEI